MLQTIDLSPNFLPFTVGSLYDFLYFTLHSLHFSLHFMTIFNNFCEHLITSVLNSTSDRLATSSSLSSVFGALICSFIWAIFLCLGTSVNVERGRVLSICQGRASHIAMLWHYMWGMGLRGNNTTCWSVSRLAVTSPNMHKRIAPFWC